MSRHKKQRRQPSQASTALNRVIVLTLFLLVAIGSFGLGTVYLRHQTATTANQIKAVERSITLEKRKLSELSTEYTALTTRESLKRLNDQYALGLQMPSERQIVLVTENVEARLYRKSAAGLVTASNF